MSESQSRYGIMEELNKKKIAVRSELAELERTLDESTFETEKAIAKEQEVIEYNERNYEAVHKQKVRSLEVQKKLLTQDYNRKSTQAQESLDDENSNYKQKFKDWKKTSLANVAESTEALARHTKTQNSLITEQKEILKEIETGISDLKEMSSEQVKKEK